MAGNLTVHATVQRDRAQGLLSAARAALDTATNALGKRVPDPGAVEVDVWRDVLGAEQYLEAAVAHDTGLRAAEAAVREQLAAIPTPADHAALVALLTANLLAQGESRVLRRDAQERLAIARGDVAAADAAARSATAALAGAQRWLATASQQQTGVSAEKALLAAPPLDTIAADSAALKASQAYADAEETLRSRLPDALVDRSAQRYAEADFIGRRFSRLAAAAQTAREGIDAAGDPLAAAAAAADRDLAHARAVLRGYATSAPERLSRAAAILARLATLPAVTADEAAALDPDSTRRPDADAAKAAVPQEEAVATAWETYAEADIAVEKAVYAALAANPDADPQAAAPVVAARAARDAPAVAGALNTARTAYTAAARKALDSWEAAAPRWLWAAARDFHEADALLTGLADGATATGLIGAVDAALDRVAAAHDALAVHQRAAIRIEAERARAEVRAAALTATAPQRVDAFVRGDDLGGRHDDEF